MLIKILTNIDCFSMTSIDFQLPNSFYISNNTELKKQYFKQELFSQAIGGVNNGIIWKDSFFAFIIADVACAPSNLQEEVDKLTGVLNGYIVFFRRCWS